MQFVVNVSGAEGSREQVAEAIEEALSTLIETVDIAQATVEPMGDTVLVFGDPSSGFTFVGPVTPNDSMLELYTDRDLKNQYWWYCDLKPLRVLTDAEEDELKRLEAAFDAAGGRGVDLADRIDALRAKRGDDGYA